MRGAGESLEAEFSPTKFMVPSLAAGVVDRPVLVGRLTTAIDDAPLTVVSAPAGAGKTTALVQWCGSQAERAVAWVRMHGDDADPETLAAALVAGAYLALGLDSGQSHLAAVRAGGRVSERQLTAAVTRDLARCGPLAVVLDDLHLVADEPTVRLLNRVLDDLPPDTRMIILSRSDPDLALSRRGVRRELALFGFDDLRLRSHEIAELLAHLGSGGQRSDTDVETLIRTTGGWAAGLVIKTHAAHRLDDVLDETTMPVDLDRYLLEEVLLPERSDLQLFMLQCSVLDDLSVSAVAAVTERVDGPTVLEELQRRNLFLSRVGDVHPPVYRFHDLFREFLARRCDVTLSPVEVAALHRRASAALTGSAAIRHLLAAGDEEEATGMLVDLARRQLQVGHHVPQAWHRMMSEAVMASHPYLQLVVALADVRVGRLDRALPRLNAAADALGEDHEALVTANVNRWEAAVALHEFELGAELRQWLDEQELSVTEQTYLQVGDFWTGFYTADWDTVDLLLPTTIDHALSSGEVGARSMVALAIAPELLFSGHGPDWLIERLDELLVGLDDDLHCVATELGTKAWRAIGAGNVERGRELAYEAARVSDLVGGTAWIDPAITTAQLALALIDGDHPRVERLVAEAAALAESEYMYRQLTGAFAYALARSLITRSRADEVEARCQPLLEITAKAGGPWVDLDTAMVAGLAARALGDDALARERFESIATSHDDQRLFMLRGFPRLELAGMLLDSGDDHGARNHARPTVERLAKADALHVLQAECGAHAIVLDLFAADPLLGPAVSDLTNRQQYPTTVSVPATGETLSPREVEVLSLVTNGCSNREIAERLVITERTVKSHMTSVMRKLGVANRTQAARVAIELGLARSQD